MTEEIEIRELDSDEVEMVSGGTVIVDWNGNVVWDSAWGPIKRC